VVKTIEEYKNIIDLFVRQAGRFGDQAALRHKRDGRWVPITWTQWEREVRRLAAGLVKLGMEVGDKVSLVSSNRPEWVHFDLATQMAGGVLVSIYPTLTAEEIKFINDDARVRFAVVEDAAQLEKMLSVAGDLPGLEKIILIEGASDDPRVVTYEELLRIGTEKDAAVLDERVKEIGHHDIATLVYTLISGPRTWQSATCR